MPDLTIYDLDEPLLLRLSERAVRNGRSVEEEVRAILGLEIGAEVPPPRAEGPVNLAAAIRARIAPLGGADLDLPGREPMPELPDVFRGRR